MLFNKKLSKDFSQYCSSEREVNMKKDKNFEYLMFNAPSSKTIKIAASLGCNWVIIHSAGIESGFKFFPIYFEDYPKVAQIRHFQQGERIEFLRKEIKNLSEYAKSLKLKVAFHMYEPIFPSEFETEYPELVGVWKRPTQMGVIDVHSNINPDNPETWKLFRSKYAELAREFPLLDMIIISTWDGDGIRICTPKAKMPIHERLVRLVKSAKEGVDSVRKGVTICFRLWGRNFPREVYLNVYRRIAKLTGVKNADELMEEVTKPDNDPDVILPKVFAELPKDVPIMYKSTKFDIADAQPITHAIGTYDKKIKQIMEISYELYNIKPWPWCKIRHIRLGLDNAKKYDLDGVLLLPINMGNNLRDFDPETGNLGRMNTWLLDKLLKGDKRSDLELVSEWLEKEFEGPQPKEVAEMLLEAEDLVDKGINWGGGCVCRHPFASLHTNKLYWMCNFEELARIMEEPERKDIERLIEQRHVAYERACDSVEKIKAFRASMNPKLYAELIAGFTMLADYILLCRDWNSYILMQYAIERKLYPADRLHLGRMSRYVENFIRNIERLKDTEVGKFVFSQMSFPDKFPLT